MGHSPDTTPEDYSLNLLFDPHITGTLDLASFDSEQLPAIHGRMQLDISTRL
jgi:hypothetical protein